MANSGDHVDSNVIPKGGWKNAKVPKSAGLASARMESLQWGSRYASQGPYTHSFTWDISPCKKFWVAPWSCKISNHQMSEER